jgi:hypothetical protein
MPAAPANSLLAPAGSSANPNGTTADGNAGDCGWLACCRVPEQWISGSVFTTVNGFKGPTDVDDLNGDFGLTVGTNLGFRLLEDWGIGAQAGTSFTGSDFKGSWYDSSGARRQEFTTLGFFRRHDGCEGLNCGLVYDLLDDAYFADFHFGQWRGIAGWQFNETDEAGVWFTISSFGTNVLLGSPRFRYSLNRFEPISQVNAYWRHLWSRGATTELFLGAPTDQNMGEMIFGARASSPLTDRIALIGGFNYVLPSTPGGGLGRSEELWSVFTGIEFTFGGGACAGQPSRFAPLLPVADQGSLAVGRIR